MVESAEGFNFEAAARIRDRIIQVRRVPESQKVVWTSRLDMDLIAIARSQGQACMQVFMVRGGKLIGQEHFILDGVHDQSDAELMDEFLKQFYTAEPRALRRTACFLRRRDALRATIKFPSR